LSVRGRGAPQAGRMREIRAQWGPHRTSAARYPLDERGCGMHFLSQYSSFTSQLFDGHLLGNDSRWIVTQPTWTARPSQTIENVHRFSAKVHTVSLIEVSPSFESNSRLSSPADTRLPRFVLSLCQTDSDADRPGIVWRPSRKFL
jgi:hypothetical protein